MTPVGRKRATETPNEFSACPHAVDLARSGTPAAVSFAPQARPKVYVQRWIDDPFVTSRGAAANKSYTPL